MDLTRENLREWLSENGWKKINSCPGPKTARKSELGFYTREERMIIVQAWEGGSGFDFFEAHRGGTLESVEIALQA